MASPSDTLRLVPGHDTVGPALRWLEDIAAREGWPARTRFALTLSMDEALTNIMSYAFRDAPPAPDAAAPDASASHAPAPETPAIVLAYRRDGADLCIDIGDNGTAYDPTAWSPAPLARTLVDATPGGHGLRLMRHYLKDLRYRREGGWNRLTLVAEQG
ncbi:ATP-binding protein [Bordetella bronchialis]|uniref:ATP-binding protein n=1 Tax=Bordetella bronchialis TaxID=463025 RepID=UPI003D079DF6